MAVLGSGKEISNDGVKMSAAGHSERLWSGGTVHTAQQAARDDYAPLIALDFNKLLLLFVIGSVGGLALENICHAILYGGYENRFGLVWGPFSPMYGVGAVVFTVILNHLWHYSNIAVFVVSMTVGSVVEFATSWGMEHFFGAIAWDYKDTFLNLDGRVNLMFALMWGMLGLVWARAVVPFIKRSFERIDWESALLKVSAILLTAFLAVNILVTVQALNRESERARELPAADPFDQFLDEHFPTDWMQEHFENMSIYGAP